MLPLPRPNRTRFVLLIAAPLFLALLAVLALTRDLSRSPPVLSGQIWRVRLNNASHIAYVTSEEREKTVASEIGRYLHTHPYIRYQLELRRIGDGALVRRTHLGDVPGTTSITPPTVLGVANDVLWIWRDSLEGRAVADFSLRHSLGTLSFRAPATPAAIPTAAKDFVAAPDSTVVGGIILAARGRDARFYRIDATSHSVDLLDPLRLPPTTSSSRIEDRFDFIDPAERANGITQFNNILTRSFLTRTGWWYSLLSDSEREDLSQWPSAEDRPYGQVARTLYRVAYRLDDRGKPVIDPRALQPVGNERLIQAGFLARRWGVVWDVADPSSSLIVGKEELGEEEPWSVARLTREGKLLWRTSTGLVESESFLALDAHVLFVGMEQSHATHARGTHVRELVVWIDERTGAKHTLDIATGAVR